MAKQKRSASKSTLEGMSGGIILIGLGVLFLWDAVPFWPWILLVVGLASLPGSIANEGLWAGMQGFVWMAGLAFLFAGPIPFWPGILILAGVSMMVGAMVQPPALKKRKNRPSIRAGMGELPEDLDYRYGEE